MNRPWMRWMAMVLALGMAVNWAEAQGQGKGRGGQSESEKTAGDKVREVLPASEPVFTTREITLIKNWFVTNHSNLPPGLAKRETLPPGLEKQLRQKGTLPPGLQKKIQPLPFELDRQLTRLPTGYRRVVIAGNVIVMNPVTGLIYDIVRNVIP
ncbi:MAG: hypothetical protein HY649_02835 [Acidobacteria bacterium]|nr:hypothetical protein [Acidobacteriota bacterium]